MQISYDNIEIKGKLLIEQGTLKINYGEVILIKGKNGTGKSLLLKNLFYNAINSGFNAVLVDQSNDQLFENASVLENISMTTDGEKNCYINKKLQQMNLDYLLQHKTKELSGGEKRLIVLLRGLLAESELILIDEPTNDLDYLIVNKFCEILKENLYDKKIIIVTHDDRLDYLSKKILIVQNKKLNNLTESPSDSFNCKKEYKTKIISKSFLKKRFNTRMFAFIIYALLCIMGLFCCFIISFTAVEEIAPINENQIDIFIPISSVSESLMKGAVPSNMVKIWSEKWNFSDLTTYLKNINTPYSDDAISFCLELNETKTYTPYPMEYIDILNKNTLITLIDMSEKYYSQLGTCNIDTSKYFEVPFFDEEGSSVEFDPQLFCGYLNEYNSSDTYKNYELVYVIIKLKPETSFYDFINDTKIQEILSGNYYIRSNETITFTNTANKVYSYMNSTLIFIAFLLIVVFIELIFTFIFMKAHSKHILALRNYGYRSEEVLEQILIVTNTKKYKIFVCLFIAIISIIRISTNINVISFADFLLFIISTICLSVSQCISNVIKKKKIQKVMEWKYRW